MLRFFNSHRVFALWLAGTLCVLDIFMAAVILDLHSVQPLTENGLVLQTQSTEGMSLSLRSHIAKLALGMTLSDAQLALGGAVQDANNPALYKNRNGKIDYLLYVQRGTDGSLDVGNITVISQNPQHSPVDCNRFIPEKSEKLAAPYIRGAVVYVSQTLKKIFSYWPIGPGVFVIQMAKGACTINIGTNG